MDHLWSIKRFCRWRYELADDAVPTRGQVNTVERMCRDGVLPAVRVGRQWRIATRTSMEAFDG